MSEWFDRFKRRALADRRKLGAMLALLFVAMLLWGRLLLKDVPRTAVAEPGGAATAAAVSGGQKKVPKSSTGPMMPRIERRPVIAVDLPEEVSRDPFAFLPTFYGGSDGSDIAPDPEKSVDQPADEDIERQRRHNAVAAEARRLTLQSTLVGRASRAMINGQLLRIGERIEGFELTGVGSRQVTLKKDDVEVVLEM